MTSASDTCDYSGCDRRPRVERQTIDDNSDHVYRLCDEHDPLNEDNTADPDLWEEVK